MNKNDMYRSIKETQKQSGWGEEIPMWDFKEETERSDTKEKETKKDE